MRILVTGAAGFIGFHLCSALLDEGFEVVGLDNINDYYSVDLKFSRLRNLGIDKSRASIYHKMTKSSLPNSNFSFVRCNLENRIELPRIFEESSFDMVCNLAAQAGVRFSLENPESYIDSNIVGFLNVLECCRNFDVKDLLYASSSSVYGENDVVPFRESDIVDKPISVYAATKKANELLAFTYSHLFDLRTSGLRFFTVYGPWGRPDMAIYRFVEAITRNRSIDVYNNGNMMRDFTYVSDIIDGILILISQAKQGSINNKSEVYNIGHGSPTSLMDFIHLLEKYTGRTAQLNFMPKQPGDVSRTFASIEKLNKMGYKPKVSLNQGIEDFVNWYFDYYRK